MTDVYSDALLSAHEAEIVRLEALKEQRAPTLQLIDRHRSLIKDREDLAASSQDASRLMNRGTKGEKRDPTRLLREEKMRKRITKELPKIEADLRKTLERWEDEYGRPFMVHGERYLDELAASANKTLPPRSKTPSGPAPSTKTISSAPPPRGSSSVRTLPPPRSGARTPTGPVARNPLASSVSTAGGRTPSKIPARAPLGNMRHGGNSPERRVRPESRQDIGTLRKMAPPAKAPPPKMRELFVPPPAPTPMSRYEHDGQRSGSVICSDESVQPTSPEDVYDDGERMSYLQSSMIRSQRSTPQTYHDLQPAYGARHYQSSQSIEIAASRQISTTSSATNTVSGSENWETYDDASDPEPDASEAYYAKLKAARGKRFTPDGGYTPPHGGQGKKFKGIRAVGMGTETLIEEEGSGQLVRVSGSEAGWTDEDAF